MKKTPLKILNTAEKLFAMNGVDATSLREINTAAGTSQGVLHYHFDSKDQLLEAILERRMQPLMEERAVMLDQLIQSRQSFLPRHLLEVIALPLAKRMIEGGPSGRRTVRLLARLYAEDNPVHQRVADRYFNTSGYELLKLMKIVLPDSTEAQLELRMQVASGAIFSTIAHLDRPYRNWQRNLSQQAPSQWDLVNELLDYLAQGFGGTKPK